MYFTPKPDNNGKAAEERDRVKHMHMEKWG